MIEILTLQEQKSHLQNQITEIDKQILPLIDVEKERVRQWVWKAKWMPGIVFKAEIPNSLDCVTFTATVPNAEIGNVDFLNPFNTYSHCHHKFNISISGDTYTIFGKLCYVGRMASFIIKHKGSIC